MHMLLSDRSQHISSAASIAINLVSRLDADKNEIKGYNIVWYVDPGTGAVIVGF